MIAYKYLAQVSFRKETFIVGTEFRSELSVDTINSINSHNKTKPKCIYNTCVDYEPTDKVLKVAKSATLAYNREHASSVSEKVL